MNDKIKALIIVLASEVGNPFSTKKYIEMFTQFIQNGNNREQIFQQFGQTVLDILYQIKACYDDPNKSTCDAEQAIRKYVLFEE